jgi:signal peptidase I
VRIKSFLGIVLVATTVACLVRLCLVEDYRISSNSMIPSLFSGDLVFVNKSVFNFRIPFANYEVIRFHRPKPSDVIAFTLPDRGLETFVKRVVAVEGDKVAIRDSVFYVNDKPAQYRSTDEPAPKGTGAQSVVEWEDLGTGGSAYKIIQDKRAAKDYGPVDIPPGFFFALGDNRVDSVDSRIWGPIPFSCLKGRVELVWLSIDQLGEIRRDRVGVRVE